MVRISNILLGLFNVVILVIGLAAIVTGLIFYVGGNSQCVKGVHNQLLITGSALVLVSFIGLIGSCYRVNFFLIIYLVVLFLLVVALILFTIFSFLVSHEAAGKAFSHFKLVNFKTWVRDHFVNDKNWNQIRDCLIDSKICSSLGDTHDVDKNFKVFYEKNFSPIQAGCCKPPSECWFVYKNATFWIKPKTGAAVKNRDCDTWSNIQTSLCYNCETCKDGIVTNIKHKWKLLAILNCVVIVILIVLYCLGCCARTSNSYKKPYPKFRGYRAYP